MIEHIELGSAPFDEDCVQTEPDREYLPQMTAEVDRYVGMLEKRFPEGAEYGIVIRPKTFQHDFGPYMEAVAVYNGDDEEAGEFAFWMQENLPALWSDESVLLFKKETCDA